MVEGEQQRTRDIKTLLETYKTSTDDEARAEAKELLVARSVGLVEFLARRFRNRGENHEDLVQVGMIGLLKALDRFDLERQVEFSTYATPTIVGEIKRHFRDKGWAVRVPRRLQELHLQINKTIGPLGQELGRSPTVAEIANATGLDEEEVLEGLEAAHAYSLTSLDAPTGEEGDDSGSLMDRLGTEDQGMELLESRASLAPEMDKLPARERQILYYRFYRGMTQSDIAVELGISQMHVSRLLSQSLSELREALEE